MDILNPLQTYIITLSTKAQLTLWLAENGNEVGNIYLKIFCYIAVSLCQLS